MQSDCVVEIDPEKRRGRTVRQINLAQAIESDHSGRHPRQYRLGKPAPLVELAVRLPQLTLLALDLKSHAVECAAERSKFVVLFPFGHSGRQVPSAYLLGRGDKTADRT